MSEDPLETIILQTINGAIATIPGYLKEIKENKETLKVENADEFVYGMVMGMGLVTGQAMISMDQDKPPTKEDEIRVRDIIYKHMPEIRERIFNS
jgi:hypothetical protein|tara:strand:+ start:342 stop:626 length:285 start_codon:yes stop_codon:yes gene_type:complete